MTEGLKRFYGDDDLHFITCSCHERQPLLNTPEIRNVWLDVLEQVRLRYQFVVVGYVVMPEHFHLLMTEPKQRDPSVVMQVLKQESAKKIIALKRRSTIHTGPGSAVPVHIWQPRFYDFNVWSKRKRIEKLRYIHRNPVVRGLVEAPERWEWSSYRAYAYGDLGRVLVNELQLAELAIRKPA